MAAIMLQTIPNFYAKNSEKVSLFLQVVLKSTLFVKTTALPVRTTRRVFYPLVKITFYYLVLLGEVERLLHELDAFCCIYQHVDCLYTLFNYRFKGKFIAKSGHVFDNVQSP